MAKLVYDESDSIFIKNSLKIALKSIESMNLASGETDLKRLKSIINQMDTIEEPKQESGSTTAVSDCKSVKYEYQ